MMQIWVIGIGIAGPGLDGWVTARPILAGDTDFRLTALAPPIPKLLSAAERRRCSQSARLAIAAAQDALLAGPLQGDAIATVFASSDGDGVITQEICESLAGATRDVSPTSFHNSVYNAPAGYWSIATRSQLSSTSVCAYDASFAAGLLEAATYAIVEQCPVMLVASDLPFPSPLHDIRPVGESFAAALLLAPTGRPDALMRCDIGLAPHQTITPFPAAIPDSLRSNPAARSLPLLAALAREAADTVRLAYTDEADLVINCVSKG